MTYQKPEVLELGSALVLVQGVSKPNTSDLGGTSGAPAADVDE